MCLNQLSNQLNSVLPETADLLLFHAHFMCPSNKIYCTLEITFKKYVGSRSHKNMYENYLGTPPKDKS